jgi:transposase-like protein
VASIFILGFSSCLVVAPFYDGASWIFKHGVVLFSVGGFPEAVENVYPRTRVQLCIVHMLRNSFKFVEWKERKEVAAELKSIYTAPTADAAEDALI